MDIYERNKNITEKKKKQKFKLNKRYHLIREKIHEDNTIKISR